MSEVRLVDVQAIAQLLNVSVSWVYQNVRPRQGKNALPHIRVGKYLRFDPEQVLRFVTRNQS